MMNEETLIEDTSLTNPTSMIEMEIIEIPPPFNSNAIDQKLYLNKFLTHMQLTGWIILSTNIKDDKAYIERKRGS